jgi:predicted O-methyltransferase YrrM/Flp pilus assembly protein TadD
MSMDINNLLTSAFEHHKKGDLQTAELLYREILAIQPDNFYALHYLGILYILAKKPDAAITYLAQTVAINPPDAHALYNLGVAFQMKGKLDEAVTYYDKSLEINPGRADTHYNLGNIMRFQERHDEAITFYKKALELKLDFAEASLMLNLALKEKKQMQNKTENINWISMIGKKIRLESICHPHCEEEKAYLYHTFDAGGTELEVLKFLRSVIILFKPSLILETGAWFADGTVALGTALKENGFGKLITLEIDEQMADRARMKIHQFGLNGYAEVINQPSLEFIENLDSTQCKFDFAFFDSRPTIRPMEFQRLYDKGALKDLVVFHDTSRLREQTYTEKGESQDEYVRKLDEIESKYCRGGIEFPFSKGLRVMQLRSDINPAFKTT